MRTVARHLLLGLALLPLVAQAAPPALDDALERQLDRLVLIAQHRPEQALAELQQLRDTPAAHAQVPRLRFAEARIHMLAGETDAALKLADGLAADPANLAQAELLRAGVAGLTGRTTEAAKLAQSSLARQESLCTPGDEVASLKRGCDFRTAWGALNILQQDQLYRGALRWGRC